VLIEDRTDVADAELLFAEHRQGVFRYLCRLVGRVEAAQDLTQEVFLRVSRAGVPATDPAGARAWVFRIARNLALNHLRDARRQPVPAPEADRTAPAVQELAVALAQALASLGDLDRDVFLLRETAGLSYEEIASACDISVDAVRARLYRARNELRVALDGPLSLRRQSPVSLNGGEWT
jgi:RNA polymerase sigma-70 factor (ECF subfamily)